MKKKYFFIIIFLFICEITYSQIITTDIDSSEVYHINNNEYLSYCISVQNNSNEFALFWVDKNRPMKQTDFYDYFMKKKGDFSLYNLINEYGSTLIVNETAHFSAIFSTFYKVIEPKSSFKIYLLYNHKSLSYNNLKQICRVVTAKEIKNYFHQSDLNALKALSYKSDFIVIPSNFFYRKR